MSRGVQRVHTVRVRGSEVHVLGSVFGLVEEAPRVEAAIRELAPDAVGLGVSPGDLQGLRDYLQGKAGGPEAGAEAPEVEFGEDPYSDGLAKYGEVRLPPPQLVAAVETAGEVDVPVEALDVDEETYTDTFTEHVSTWQLFWHTRRERKLEKRPPEVDTAWEYAATWDESKLRSKGLARVEALREEHMAEALTRLAGSHPVVLAVVEAPRAAGVAERLGKGR